MNTKDQAFDQLIGDIQGSIDGFVTGSSFHAVNCPMCKNRDQTQKKGGFKFEAEQIIYHCFRGSCDATTVYTLGEPIPKKFKSLMAEIGVTIPIELRARRKSTPSSEKLDDRYEKNIYKNLTFPEYFQEEITDYWADYLISRNVIYYDLDFRYVSDGPYKGSLAVPHYYFDRLIGWDYITKSKHTYITDSSSSESMLFIPSRSPAKDALIVEGMHDALCFPDTIAVKTSKVSRKQAYHLRNLNPVVLPDRSSSRLYESAKEYGWRVCIPMWKEKDLDEVVKNRGIMVAAKMIHDGTMNVGAKSELLYNRWVKL